jgi:hypothetical protein
MNAQWKSQRLYEHPAEHQQGTYGHIELSDAGVYVLRVGSSHMSCPQDWAAKIHHDEIEPENTADIIIRKVPSELHTQVKSLAALKGTSIQELTILALKRLIEETQRILS